MAKDKQSNVKKEKENKKYFKEFKAELKKVSWPTFDQLVKNTVAVVTIVLFTAVIIFVLDLVFESVNTFGVNRLKELVTSTEVTDDHNHELTENVVSNEAVDTTTANDANAENVISNNVVSE